MKIEIFQSLNQISAEDWKNITPSNFPFASYQFLQALEGTGCLGARTGWKPVYITVWQETLLLGAHVLYLKTNSYGEYIFDFSWAQAFESSGLSYYPKVVSAVPFTPATGPKILLTPSASKDQAVKVRGLLLKAASEWTAQTKASSLHALFIPTDEISTFEEADFFIRHSFQFHWTNKDYKNFQNFLEDLKSKRRKEILRERSMVAASGVKIERLTGAALKPHHGELMYQFYLSTIDKMQGMDYLTLDFFKTVFETMKDQILFVLATDAQGLEVAGALNFYQGSTLFGRNWGCLDEYKGLHFELCYYQGIEFVIENKMKLFEAGAQGEHKFQRGFMPTLTYSAHQIRNAKWNQPIQDFVGQEKIQIEKLFKDYLEHTPFAQK